MLQEFVKALERGTRVGCGEIFAKDISGRFAEEQDLAVLLSQDDDERLLLWAKVYHGRPPYFAPWVELFCIEPLGESYFGSDWESALWGVVSAHIPRGGRVFVEYHEDLETRLALERGYPPAVTRLGYRLLRSGFTWFKDWYFPEGFREGGQKLQAERSLTDADRSRHLQEIARQVEEFLGRAALSDSHRWYAEKAIKRAGRLADEGRTAD